MTALDSYPPSWCGHCQTLTAFDGWGLANGGLVELYCQGCGHKKVDQGVWLDELPMKSALRQEVMRHVLQYAG